MLALQTLSVSAQKYSAEKSFVSFYSHAAIEDIKAENTSAKSLFNASTGDVAFSIPIKDFEFAKSLMKEHFNEKYLESDKYPKATFQGKIESYDPHANGEQHVVATGKLTIHGVTKNVDIPGTLEIKSGGIIAHSNFKIRLEDYKISIPQLLWTNIAEEVEVTIQVTYKPI